MSNRGTICELEIINFLLLPEPANLIFDQTEHLTLEATLDSVLSYCEIRGERGSDTADYF